MIGLSKKKPVVLTKTKIRMKKWAHHLVVVLLGLSMLTLTTSFGAGSARAQETSPITTQVNEPAISYQKGRITKVLEEKTLSLEMGTFYTQVVEVAVSGQSNPVRVSVGSDFQPLTAKQLLKPGTQVIVSPSVSNPEEWTVVDVYRLPVLAFVGLGLVVLIFAVARLRGVLALVGMGLSWVVLAQFTLPQLLSGQDPVLVSVVTAAAVAAATLYLSHGWHLKSHLSLLSIMLTLIATLLLAKTTIFSAQLVGLGSEEAYFLQFGQTGQLNLQGLLLAGIILGTLGVLDDIVISQISLVAQLKAVNKKLRWEELYSRGLEVGKDHIAALINTLVLVYAGANLPLFILFFIQKNTPPWVILNSEMVAEEIIRTLTGSIGLVLAVPVATLVASLAFANSAKNAAQAAEHGHKHSH
jgi:uncharacterized membrane protein